MADASVSDIVTLIRAEPDRVLAELAETLGAVVGETCTLTAVDDDAARAPFSGTACWSVPWSGPDEDGSRGLIALDAPVVIRAGGALAMQPADAIAAALESGEVPDSIAASLPGIGNLLVGALSKLRGGTELSAGDAGAVEAGPWPALVAAAGEGAVHLCARLAVGDDAAAGTLVVATSAAAGAEDADGGSSPAGGAARTVNLDGMTVRMIGRPGDPAQVALADVVESLGGRVLQMHQNSLLADPPAAAFVVSRSPSDLRARMETLAADDERPALVVACSDRPTRDLVLTARQAGASDFLVLPTTRERLCAVLKKALQPA